ncbi:hypothetical protein ACGF0D_39300 [Kitasatospora sp. NPDC048298]|uniref:hypothetical protein n=1 Tax=Kitasatospora sp. NPDC048298 TaxID=3364049 RepID=UPI003716427D
MTDASMPHPDDDAVDRWLTAQQSRHVNGLTGFLDVEAGLREALVYARHDAMVQDLAQTLDIEGGLAAILPGATPAPANTEPAPANSGSAIDEDLHSGLVALTPRKRLWLRPQPAISASVKVGPLVRVLDLAFELNQALARGLDLARSLDFDRDRVVDLAHNLALLRALGRDLDYVCGPGGVFNLSLNQDVIDPALNRANALNRALGRASNYVSQMVRDLAHDLESSHRLARNLSVAPNLNLGRTVERNLVDLLARGLGLARELARSLVLYIADDLRLGLVDPRNRAFHISPDVVRVIACARELANELGHNHAFDPVRGLTQDHDPSIATGRERLALSQDLAHGQALARDLDSTLNQAVHGLLGLDVAGEIAPEALYDLLDDFTQADLSTVDLAGIDLEGIRWSDYATRWPAAMDIGRLREQSLETPVGSGIYTVRRGTTATDLVRV